MKNLIIALTIILIIPIVSFAGSIFHIGFTSGYYDGGYNDGGYYHEHLSRTIIHHGGGYYGHRPIHIQPIYRPVVNGYGHIHRQAGRRYVNDMPCAPVVVIPSGSSYYRYESETYYGY
jgi:hypothetical protein